MSIQQHYDLPPFSAVEVSAGVEAQLGSGIQQLVWAEAEDAEALDRLRLEVRGKTLHVSFRHGFLGFAFGGHKRLLVSIAAPVIERATASSGADVHLVGSPSPQLEVECSSGAQFLAESIDVERLTARCSSGSKLTLSGTAMIAELASSSGSSLDADGLEALRIDADSSSGSRISAAARDAARVDASSGASVELRGRPARVKQHSSSGGSIRFA